MIYATCGDRLFLVGCVLLSCLVSPMLGSPRQQIQPPPAFRSVPTTVRARENASAVLPCYIENQGANTVRWVRGEAMLAERNAVDTSSRRSVLLPRAIMHPDNALEVEDLEGSDAGDYECQVLRQSPLDPCIRQTHTIEVLFPASVSLEPEESVVTVQLGDKVNLFCAASGVPAPVIAWTAMGGALLSAMTDDELRLLRRHARLQFHVASRQATGVYRCEASNDVGPVASASLTLVVQHPPEIASTKDWVHTSPGLRAELSCIVIAEPPAKVTWYHVGADGAEPEEVLQTSRVSRLVAGQRHSLLVRNVRPQDLGTFLCSASNTLGEANATATLSGAPNAPVIKSDSNMATANSYDLIWEVDSYSPIFGYTLQFRKYGGAEWRNLTVPAGAASSGALTSHAFVLRGLESDTQYEALLAARNRFGWSAHSPLFAFTTLGPGETPLRIIELGDADEEQVEHKKTIEPTFSDITTKKPAKLLKAASRNSADTCKFSVFIASTILLHLLFN